MNKHEAIIVINFDLVVGKTAANCFSPFYFFVIVIGDGV